MKTLLFILAGLGMLVLIDRYLDSLNPVRVRCDGGERARLELELMLSEQSTHDF